MDRSRSLAERCALPTAVRLPRADATLGGLIEQTLEPLREDSTWEGNISDRSD